jgi:O-antigen ligase
LKVTRSSLSRWLGAASFYGLLAVIALAAAPYGSVEPWWAATVEVSIFALAALSLVACALDGGRFLARGQEVFAPLAALALYAWVQSRTVSYDPFESQLFALKALALAFAGAMLARHAATGRRLRALVCAIVAAGLASSAFGIVRQTTQRGARGFLLPYLSPGTGYAQFINKNHFAFLAEMSLGLLAAPALAAAARRRDRGRALAYAALAVPVWAALVLSNSRGGVLAMLCQALFLAATYGAAARAPDDAGAEGHPRRGRSRRAARLALSTLLLIALVVGVAWVGGDPLADRFGSTRGELGPADSPDNARASRNEIWKATWEMIKDNPAAGVGFGGYWAAVPLYHRASGAQVPQQAHNDYLELPASGGIVGTLLALAFVPLFARRARRRLRSRSDFGRAAAWGALAGLVGVAAHSLVDFGLHVTSNALVAVALCAVAVADAETAATRVGE